MKQQMMYSDAVSSSEAPPVYRQTEGDIPTSFPPPTEVEDSLFEKPDHIIPVNNDDRINLQIEDLGDLYKHFAHEKASEKTETMETTPQAAQPPRMNVLMLVVGSRGDVQPFVALAQALMDDGHRLRLVTHPHFRSFVEAHNIEFFSTGGDPAELMAYMVQNPGLVPKFAALRRGEIQKRRRSMREMVHASWRACFEAGRVSSGTPLERAIGKAAKSNAKITDPKPFIADMIIANPPSLAHIHCAEKLGLPLHVMFT